MPLSLIARLGDLLNVAPTELFARPADETPAPADDDRAVEAALASLDGVVAVSDLAQALEWTLDRTRAALDVLEVRLGHTGCRLHPMPGSSARSVRRPSTLRASSNTPFSALARASVA
jgi:hypothetical protein